MTVKTPMASVSEIFNRHREGYLYLIFGGLTTLVTWFSYSLLVWSGIELNISNILSWTCGVLFAFVVNKWIVFSSKSVEAGVIVKELGTFFSARILTGIIAFVLFPILYAAGLNQSMFMTDGFVAKIAVTVIEIALNWLFSKHIVFKKKNLPLKKG